MREGEIEWKDSETERKKVKKQKKGFLLLPAYKYRQVEKMT